MTYSFKQSKSCRTSTVQRASGAGVPVLAGFSSRRAEAFANLFQTVCDHQAIDELDVLVAHLPGEPPVVTPSVVLRSSAIFSTDARMKVAAFLRIS